MFIFYSNVGHHALHCKHRGSYIVIVQLWQLDTVSGDLNVLMHEQEGRCMKSHIEQLEWIWSELISISQRYIYTISVGQMSAWHPVPFIPPHMEDTEMRKSLPTIQDKRELAGGRVDGGGGARSLDEENSLQLLHFVVAAREAQWQLQRADILWYIVREAFGQNAKHSWWKSDILFKDHVGDTQKPTPAFLKHDFKFTVYFPRWSYDLLKDVELKLLSVCDVRFLGAKACVW